LDFAGDSSEAEKYCGVWESWIRMREEAAAKRKAASKEPEVAAADGGVEAGTSEWSVTIPPNPKKRKLDAKVRACFLLLLADANDFDARCRRTMVQYTPPTIQAVSAASD